MKIKSLPKEFLIEVLNYMADYERLEGLEQILEGEYTIHDVKTALREVVVHLRSELETEKGQGSLPNFQRDERLSTQVRQLLSVLGPGEERRLLARFGLLENES